MAGNDFLFAILAGAALALPYLRYAYRGRETKRVFAIGLVVAVLVYVVFALIAGELRQALIECSGVVLFGILGLLGLRRSSHFLVLGWAGHVAWDLLLHPVAASSYAPWWYPVACIGFDLIVAGAIAGAVWRRAA